MSDERARAELAGPMIMLISAAIFGYFGFGMRGPYTSPVTGQLVPFWPLLAWTLKASSVAFVVAAVASFVSPLGGNLLYAVVGLAGAVALLVVAVMDYLDPRHTAAIPPLLLLIFVAWNGYGSWVGLKAVLALRERRDARDETFPTP